MAKKKAQKPTPIIISQDRAPCWEVFFRDQRSPLLRSQLITALMSGHQLEVERLPHGALLDAVVLSMTTRSYFDAEIIDDYTALLRHVDELWRDPMWTKRIFDQYHTNAASYIIRGSSRFVCAEDLYIPDLVGWLLEHEPPQYFSEELAA